MPNPLDRFVMAGNANYHTHAKDTVINKLQEFQVMPYQLSGRGH
jgi:hypothetical protein